MTDSVRPAFALMLGATSCASPSGFGSDLDRYTCERQYECAQGAFDAMYGDVGECRAERDDANGPVIACELESCSYDASKARECIHDIRSADCAEIVDGSAWVACDEVFVECDDDVLYACLGAL